MRITTYLNPFSNKFNSINDFSKMEASTPRLTLALKCSVVALSVLIGLVTLGIGGLIFFRAVVKSDPNQLTYAQSQQKIQQLTIQLTAKDYDNSVEKTTLTDKIAKLESQIDSLSAKSLRQDGKIKNLTAQIAQDDKEALTLEAKFTELKENIQANNKLIDQLKDEKDQAMQSLKNESEKVLKLQSEIAEKSELVKQLDAELTRLRDVIAEKDETIEDLKISAEQLSRDKDDAEGAWAGQVAANERNAAFTSLL